MPLPLVYLSQDTRAKGSQSCLGLITYALAARVTFLLIDDKEGDAAVAAVYKAGMILEDAWKVVCFLRSREGADWVEPNNQCRVEMTRMSDSK
jgi:hypothetical protein